ncbi:hypothetical protein DFJ74DRAFT_431828 [Hyaloraphidium curvatum]|nr:hypothetical protein DFJ74DRAFT_431828 [Hyaloraphidium curvatum]
MGDRWQEQPDPRVAYYGPPGDDRARAANQNVPPRQSKEHKDGSVAMQQYRNPQAPPAKGQAQRAPRDLEAPSERDRDRPRRPKDSDCREGGQRPPDRGQRYDGPRDAPPRDDAPRDGPNRDDRPVKATQKMTQAPPDDDELVIITEMVPNKRRKTDESAGGRRTLPGGDVDRPPRPHSNPTAGFMPRDMQEGMKGRRDDSYDGAKGRQGYRDQRQRDPSRRMEDPRAQSDGRSGEQGHGRQRGPDPDLPAPKGSPSRAVPSYAGGFERARNYGDNASPPRAGHAMPRGSPARAPASKPVQQSLAPIFPPSAAQQAPAKNVSPPIPEPAAPAAPSTLEHVEEPAGNPAPKQPRKKQLAEVPVGQESFVTAKQQLVGAAFPVTMHCLPRFCSSTTRATCSAS